MIVAGAESAESMDALFQILLRMARWVRHPPSRRHLWVMIVVVAVAAFCVGFEYFFGWPDFLTVQRPPRHILPRP